MSAFSVISFSNPAYKKCECCDRVKDIFYRVDIMDNATKTMLTGSIDMCKNCGLNFADIIGQTVVTERVIEGGYSFE